MSGLSISNNIERFSSVTTNYTVEYTGLTEMQMLLLFIINSNSSRSAVPNIQHAFDGLLYSYVSFL